MHSLSWTLCDGDNCYQLSGLLVLSMSIRTKSGHGLPNPSGSLSTWIPLQTVALTNETVEEVLKEKGDNAKCHQPSLSDVVASNAVFIIFQVAPPFWLFGLARCCGVFLLLRIQSLVARHINCQYSVCENICFEHNEIFITPKFPKFHYTIQNSHDPQATPTFSTFLKQSDRA